ncbi:MAG: lipopolysaccharide biosynthesis protein [Lishizhenia sp.]
MIKKTISTFKKLQKSMMFAMSTFLVGGLNALTLPIFTRLLSKADYGILSVTSSFQTISASIFRLGTHQSVLKQYLEINEKEKKNYFFSVVVFSIIWSFLLIIFTLILSFFGLFNSFEGINFYPYILLSFLTASFATGYALFQSELRIRNLAKQYVILTVFYVILSIVLSIVLIYYFKLGVIGKLLGNLIPYGIVLFYMITVKRARLKIAYWYDAIKFGFPLSLSSLFSSFIMIYAIGILTQKLTLSDLGVYQMTKNLGLLLPDILFQAVTLTYLPFLYRSFKDKSIIEITKTNSRLILFFAFALFVIMLMSPYIILLFTTSDYLSGVDLMRIFVMSFFFKIVHYVPMIELYHRGKTTLISIIEILSLVIFLIIIHFSIDIYGLSGVGIAYIVQEIFKTIWYIIYSNLHVKEIFNFYSLNLRSK